MQTMPCILSSYFPGSNIRLLLLENDTLQPSIPPFFLGYIGIPNTYVFRGLIEREASLYHQRRYKPVRVDSAGCTSTEEVSLTEMLFTSEHLLMTAIVASPKSITYTSKPNPAAPTNKPVPASPTEYWFGYDSLTRDILTRVGRSRDLTLQDTCTEVDDLVKWAYRVNLELEKIEGDSDRCS